MQLTKEQKKIIGMGVGIVIFFVLFWSFIYLPCKREVTVMKEQLSLAQGQIRQINELIGENELVQVVTDLKTNFNSLKSKFPDRDEAIIGYLSQEARNLNIEIKNITISSKESVEHKISNFDMEKLYLSINLVCEFKDLGEYLNILRNESPVLVKVNTLDINGRGEGKPNLDVSLQISAYLSKRK